MLPLDDPRWPALRSGRRTLYDASVALRAMELGADVWAELWDELHHQGDVDEAAYASLPHIVRICSGRPRDWNSYALAAVIEIERHRKTNPPVPGWALESYSAAWVVLRDLALTDLAESTEPLLVHCALSVVALAQGQRKLGAMLSFMDEGEVSDFVENHMAWSGLYA